SQDKVGMGTAVAVLFVGWVIAIEISVLVVTEVLVPTGQLPVPIDFVRGLPAWFRRMRRVVKIFGIAMHHGLIRYLNRSRTSADYPGTHEPATALREALTDGGVTFVKLGQMPATRPDLLPPRYSAELSKLHSQVPADSWESVKHTFTEELGDEPEKIFQSFDPIPLA